MMAFVVEDERDQRNLIREALEEAGWTVEVAEDGIAALGRLRRVQPDVILLDLRMPRLDGIQMLKRLRSNVVERAIPVILTTGSEVASCVRLLANCVLVKPFSSDELTRAAASCTSGLWLPKTLSARSQHGGGGEVGLVEVAELTSSTRSPVARACLSLPRRVRCCFHHQRQHEPDHHRRPLRAAPGPDQL